MGSIKFGIQGCSQIFFGNQEISQVYQGSTKIWENAPLTYALSNIRVVYSSGSALHPSQSNYGQVYATCTTYRGSTVIEVEDNVILTLTSVGSNYVTISNNRLYWNKNAYGTTSVSARSISVNGTYKASGSTSVAISANSYVPIKTYTGWSPLSVAMIGHAGSTFKIQGNASYTSYKSWTSGMTSDTTYGTDRLNADDYTIPSNWITKSGSYGNYSLVVSENTSSSQRSQSVTTICQGFSAAVTISQYEAIWYEYSYYASEISQESSIAWSAYGYSSRVNLVARITQKTITHNDGQTTTTTGWYTGGSGDRASILSGNTFGLLAYNASSGDYGYDSVSLSITSLGYARCKLIARSQNTSSSQRTGTVAFYANGQRVTLSNGGELVGTLTQEGKTAPVIKPYYIDTSECTNCDLCIDVCPVSAIVYDGDYPKINESVCTGCGTCAEECPAQTIHQRQ